MPLYQNPPFYQKSGTEVDFRNSGTTTVQGNTGGLTIKGGTASSDALSLYANTQSWSSSAPNPINIINSYLNFTGQTSVANSTLSALISFNSTVSLTGASVWALAGFVFSPTFQQDTSFVFGLAPAFSAQPIFQPTVGGIADGSAFALTGYASNVYHELAHSGVAGSTTTMAGYLDGPQFARSSGTGTHTVTNYAAFLSFNPILFSQHVRTGYTVTNMSTVHAQNPAVGTGGAITNNIAIDIDAMTSGSTINAGIRNASATINTPGTAQNITAASQAITIASTVKQLTANASYTLTSAPTIANGQDGQVVTIVNVDTTDTITLQDQGTLTGSNLRLSASSIALGPRDNITLVYSSTIGDWVQVNQTNVL